MTTIAFIENEYGFVPAHVKDVKKEDVYYLIIDGVRGQVHQATSDAIADLGKQEGWRVEGEVYE